MITFDQAREIIQREVAPTWQGPGSWFLAPWGYEDARGYSMIYGAREGILQADADYADTSGMVALVDKLTGELELRPYFDVRERVRKMTPCGSPEPTLPE